MTSVVFLSFRPTGEILTTVAQDFSLAFEMTLAIFCHVQGKTLQILTLMINYYLTSISKND
jgi:hypothetical protein